MSYQYMRDELKDSYGILKLQDKILEIAVYIDKFCGEHDIDYCLMGGSALGAKRHGGFIPWDDDLDIFMTPDNYEKFRVKFIEYGDKDTFYLQEWGLTDGMVTMPKLRMNGTTYIESTFKEWDMHHGIYVDIFILHNCPNLKIQQWHQCLWAKYVIMKGLAARGYNRRGGFLGFALKVMSMFPDKMWIKHGLKQVYKYQNIRTAYYCNFFGKAVFKDAIYKKEYFSGTEYNDFEKVKLRVPIKLNEFLTVRFGNYMLPPSPKRIQLDQHAEKWYADIDFRKISELHYVSFCDEAKLI